ncbi:MAG: cell division protein ZapA [Sphingobium sp.]
MAEVPLTIGGRQYDVHCRDGEEGQLVRLAAMIDAKTAQARLSSPGLTEVRQLLFAAILLADEVQELSGNVHARQPGLALPPADTSAEDDQIAGQIDALSARLETLVATLAQRLAPEGATS